MDLFSDPKFINTNSIQAAVYEMKPEGKAHKYPVILCHGFPELAFSWRHQLPELSGAGFHAIAADGRGYGLSDAPKRISDYHVRELMADVIGIMDGKDFEKAIFVGHDWGALMMWALPFYYPDRVAGLVGLNVPFMPRGPIDPLTMMVGAYGEEFYINYFQKPGRAEGMFDEDIAKSLRFFMRKKDKTSKISSTPPLKVKNHAFHHLFAKPEEGWPGDVFLTDEELMFYAKNFSHNGFFGPINWYRNMVANWEDMAQYQPPNGPPFKLSSPTLMIMAQHDTVLPPRLADGMEHFFEDCEKYLVKDSGHWTQQECPREVNRVIIDWLLRKFPE